ncbi:hypothetical protein GCK32_007599 [Trichostrongylus colubriformis]|uniref:Uncharacterized protein n=1 Tax=Trichostrongylus colubriformis TaxID=6319 RepID=A0AAN8FN72_TRICO
MNGEQLQDFLTELSKSTIRPGGRDDIEVTKKFLAKWANNTLLLANYITVNYRWVIISQKGSKHGAGQVEEIRIPSIRYPSIYHDPTKISALPEVTLMKPGNSPSIMTTVRVGPYPTIEEFTSESKFLILTRIMKSVNGSLVYLSSDVISRHICLATLSICESGFTFPETNFVSQVMESEHSCEVLEDHSKKPRQHVNSALLLELLTGVYMALFNGAPDLALRAIDALHQRAQYEILAEVILVTSAIRNSLLENPLSKEKRDELMFGRVRNSEKLRKGLVTNASLKLRKMPEDIPIQPELKEKEHNIIEEGMDNLKRKVTALGLHHKIPRRRKNSVDPDDVELQTIREEKTGDGGDIIQRLEEISESPHHSHKVIEPSYRKESVSNEDHLATKHRKHSIDEERKEDRYRNGVNDKGKERTSSPVVERPEQLCGELRISSSDDSGTYTVSGLRHMDSGSSTQRSFDFQSHDVL